MLPESAATRILESCRQELVQAGFTKASTAVISGVQEGLYAWLAVNYIKHALPQVRALHSLSETAWSTFACVSISHTCEAACAATLSTPRSRLQVSVRLRPGSSRQECFHSEAQSLQGSRKFILPQRGPEPMSVAEMGGASLQITIAGGVLPGGAACDDLFAPIMLPRTALDGCSLLTHSFMGYGREEAFKRVSATGAAAECSHMNYEFAPGVPEPNSSCALAATCDTVLRSTAVAPVVRSSTSAAMPSQRSCEAGWPARATHFEGESSVARRIVIRARSARIVDAGNSCSLAATTVCRDCRRCVLCCALPACCSPHVAALLGTGCSRC